uniref:NADH-ubiquinone oxidoreductase chain 4L n=1 Tax=Mecistocephalus marmoratus TaxID=980230 RepID=A0A4Y1K824_9MYRI|nr:NADH dehydrogenase subunit 4L [Mecistocephalus marmoratus]ARU77317.1 NADH dehydrogenase subunit 4L [Mecistocephalus marmoratus]
MMALFGVVVYCGGWVFVSWHRHMLIMLLGLEMMMLGLFGLLGTFSGVFGGEGVVLVFLTFVVCEGSIGLGLLVGIVRSFGDDNFNNFSVLQC